MGLDRSRKGFLAQYADEGFFHPDSWTPEGLVRVEAKRMRANAYAGAVAAETPRRLGEEATSLELAGDKFLSKGVAHIYWTLWRRLCTAKNAPLPVEELADGEEMLYPPETWLKLHALGTADVEARRAGRTVLWDRWWGDMRPKLMGRRRALATFSLRTEQVSWGYRVVASIGSEIEWIDKKFVEFEQRYCGDEPVHERMAL